MSYPDSWTTQRDWSPDAITPFERMRILNPAPGKSDLSAIRRGFYRLSRSLVQFV
jgi:hypothetical protein